MAILELGVLASGNGSNLQAILDAIAAGTLEARVRIVISNSVRWVRGQPGDRAKIAILPA